jgi:threonyl-tRNA synthetase
VLPISDKSNDYARNVLKLLKNEEIRAEIDDRNEKIGRKIREAELLKIPYMVIIGEKEAAEGKLSVRRHKQGDLGKMDIDAFIKMVQAEISQKSSLADQPLPVQEQQTSGT